MRNLRKVELPRRASAQSNYLIKTYSYLLGCWQSVLQVFSFSNYRSCSSGLLVMQLSSSQSCSCNSSFTFLWITPIKYIFFTKLNFGSICMWSVTDPLFWVSKYLFTSPQESGTEQGDKADIGNILKIT